MSRKSRVVVPITEDWRRDLVIKYTGLVVYVAKSWFPRGMTIPEDIISEGRVGLCIAAARFAPERKLKFPTYAVWWVRALMLDYLIHNHGPVRIGTTSRQRTMFFQFGKARKAVGLELEDDNAALAAHLGVGEEELALMRVRLGKHQDVSLDARSEEHGERNRSVELATDESGAEEQLGDLQLAEGTRGQVHAAVRGLGERERKIIEARFLLEQPKTLDEVGREFGISRERVRQLQVRALRKLRAALVDDKRAERVG
jgi:RNA polymerase sigma-32 factor